MAEIVIENLYKSFETKDGTVEALKNVNLSIESGDIYGICLLYTSPSPRDCS